jgi:hypothetical protein
MPPDAARNAGRIWPMFSLTLVIALSPALVHANCPISDFDQQFASAGAVFLGRAIKQEVVDAPRKSESNDRMTETTFAIEDQWKGIGTTIRVRTCSWSVGGLNLTCGEDFHFEVGNTYLVFASGNPLETGGCTPTANLDRAAAILTWLAGKPHKKIG